MIVVNKPPGLVVHPAPGHEDGTLVNALLARFTRISPTRRASSGPGIVHRLDKDTSGLIVIGRTTAAMAALQLQFKERSAQQEVPAAGAGRPRRGGGRDRGADRPRPARPQADGRARGWARVADPVRRCSSATATSRWWRPTSRAAGPISFGSISSSSGIRWLATETYGNVRGPLGLRRQFVHASSMRIRSPHDDRRASSCTRRCPADLRSPLERLRTMRGFSAETLPAPDRRRPEPAGVGETSRRRPLCPSLAPTSQLGPTVADRRRRRPRPGDRPPRAPRSHPRRRPSAALAGRRRARRSEDQHMTDLQRRRSGCASRRPRPAIPHVGTAYMALFDMAYARRHGGQFVLRIEDTDQNRLRRDVRAAHLRLPALARPELGRGPGRRRAVRAVPPVRAARTSTASTPSG